MVLALASESRRDGHLNILHNVPPHAQPSRERNQCHPSHYDLFRRKKARVLRAKRDKVAGSGTRFVSPGF